jgi:transposase InsO family protein
VGIDVLSRRVFLAATKSKMAVDMKRAFTELFKQMPILPYRIFTDRGGEFKAREMHSFFRERNIQIHHSTFSSIKAGVAERCIRNVKQRLYRYFGEHRTLRWIDVIPHIAHAINHSVCRITGMRPADVDFKNAQQVWEKVYGKDFWKSPQPRKKRAELIRAAKTLPPDEHVRVAKEKEKFHKGYLPTFSDEIYQVKGVVRKKPNVYKIRDR